MARCVEFPHLLRLVQQGPFDTLYHEHFSYLSLTVGAGANVHQISRFENAMLS